jgi:hypothetical protein
MRKYKTCPHCGAHLDYGESCDCIKRAAPGVATTENGKNVCTDAKIISDADAIVNMIRDIAKDLTEEERQELLTYGKRLLAAKILVESDFD